ncbi:PhyH-domain-containing protein [Lepidopterella palustris CBS 459.81]|uniref:PhyH-domain-containing protein n=1 Tax=Lepidopterella palustris CBS 459.81 TaxID=1314670 RepID=A0A8E2E0W1_9PEZI|nr:PhyH-domain-containing protein [Lepidopterella palustris CBS 459.81]
MTMTSGRKPRKPVLRRLSRNSPTASFIEALETDGCVVVQNFTDQETLAKAQREVQPYLDVDEPASLVGALQGSTKTCTRLIGRSSTVREAFFADSLYQDLVDHFLSIKTICYYGSESSINICYPLLSVAITMDMRPGTLAQKLHRDDKNHHARHTAATTYHANRDMLLGLFVPGCDTSRENGATRVVPGSHLWGDEKPDFGEDGTKGVIDVELKAGDAFLMLGSVYHGGGHFARDEGSRTMHIMFCCCGNLRQEEVSYLSYPVEDVKGYSKIVQDRLGWRQSEPNLGWVDLKSPEFLLEGQY